jgi:hypothetical protein
VVPVVRAVEGVGAERPEHDHLAAGRRHPLGELGRGRARAEAVEEDPGGDAGPAPLGHRVGEGPGDEPVLDVVLRVGDGAPGGADRIQLRGEDLLPVQQDPHAVAGLDGGGRVGLQRREEGGVPERQRGEAEVRRRAGARRGARGDRRDAQGDPRGAVRVHLF